MTLLFKFLVGHAFGDYVFQSDMMAKAKSRHAAIYQTMSKNFPGWYYWLLAHALVHGGAVFVISGSLLLGVTETTLHTIIDFAKCEHWFGIHVDQALHVSCKVAYIWIIYQGWV